MTKALEYLHNNNVVHGDIKGVSYSVSHTCRFSWLVWKANVLVADDGRLLLSDFGRSNIINVRDFVTSTAGGFVRYVAPEIIRQAAQLGHSDDADDSTIVLTQEADVYGFSMVGVEVSLFQMTHIPVFQGHNHRFYLDNSLTPTYVTKIGSSWEFQTVYDQVGKNINCPDYKRRCGTFLSFAGSIILQTGLQCQLSYSNYPTRVEVF